MSLTTGRGPLGPDPAGRFLPPVPAGASYVEPHPRRVQALLGGQTVLDTERALLLHRPGQTLVYLFPAGDVVGLPAEPEHDTPGFVSVAWDAVDTWLEEGRQLVHYPPNPYHRVDCRPTRRRLCVEVGGITLVDTDETTIVFETSLPPRLYVDPAFVRTDLLRPSPTTTYCNYKGEASYHHAVIDGTVLDDVAWSYDDPLPESEPIRGFLSFDATRAEVFATLPTGSAVPPPA